MSDDDNIRHLWSDAELDDAFAALHPHVRTDGDELDRGRAKLMRAAAAASTEGGERTTRPSKKRAGSWRWIAVAAAVAVLTGGVVVASNLNDGSPKVMPASTPTSDNRPAAGQYTHVTNDYTVIEWVAGHSAFAVRERLEVWIPPNPRDLWKRRWTRTGEVRLLRGMPADQAALPGPTSAVQTALDGLFAEALPGSAGQTGVPNGWYQPTFEFVAALPTDPQRLSAYISQAVKSHPTMPAPVPLFGPTSVSGNLPVGEQILSGPFGPPTQPPIPPPTSADINLSPNMRFSEQVAGVVLSVITSGLASRALRASLFRVLSGVPDMKSAVQKANRTMIFTLDLADHQLIIDYDLNTDTVLRASTVASPAGKYAFPAGQPISSSEYSYDITDSSGG
ncbi:hypothetical protein OG943_33205 [Amycolatopsis sp. NBC_00345]|uniref:hypothetical protein n=1 Tax=Amycolatopsis sp. NBC_00345 TaxID=2975955 RepID=UPI002E26D863